MKIEDRRNFLRKWGLGGIGLAGTLLSSREMLIMGCRIGEELRYEPKEGGTTDVQFRRSRVTSVGKPWSIYPI